MRKRLFFILFSIIFITATVISLLIGRFSYNFVKTVLRDNREENIYRIEKQLGQYRGILNSIEAGMNESGRASLLKLESYYPSSASAGKATPEQLRKLARELNVGQIYFINSAGIVFNSSLIGDIGLNLLSICNDVTRYINSIYGKGEVTSQGISVSTLEGNINHYMYYSPKGSNIIYEISFDVSDYVKKKYNLALYEFLFKDMFKTFNNGYLNSIDLYSISKSGGWSLVNPGKKTDISPELMKRIVIEENVVLESGDKIFVYKKMKPNQFFLDRTANVYFELVYDISSLNRYTGSIILYSVIIIVVITIAAFLISTKMLNTLFLRRMMNIIDGLKMIANGDYNAVITDDEQDELSNIAANINSMAKTIKHRSAELYLSNEELRELTLYINDILESMPSIIITLDENGKIIHWNKEAGKFTGYSSDEAVGRVLWDFIPALSKYRGKCEDVRLTGLTIELLKEVFVKEDCGAEESFIKNIFIFPFSKMDITGIIIRIDDITALERNEERLNRASRVEALGTMAGGLAHDFNNIIAGIISTASYLGMLLNDGKTDTGTVLSHLDLIKQSGDKAALLVKNLMSVSRNGENSPERVNLDQIVKDVINLTRPSVPDYIEVKFNNSVTDCYIKGHRSQIEQVILNLIVNASEAIKSNGCEPAVISLVLDLLDDQKKILSIKSNVWHLSVADNGPGIDRADLKKIFDPFFTTKRDGNGLGLAVVHNIIIRHGGIIEVHSEPGSGTIFDIYLPSD